MEWILFLISAIFFYFLVKKENKWLIYGKKYHRKTIVKNNQKFIAEHSQFENARESLYYLRKLVYRFSDRKNLMETKYDLYDWSFIFFRFEDTTVKLFRYRENIQVVRSTASISIDEVDYINPNLEENTIF